MTQQDEIHFEGKIAQKVIIERSNKVLLVQDPRGDKMVWELPGGRMNVGEDPKKAMMREFFEEMGVEASVGQVVHMEQFIQGNEGKRAFVIVYKADLPENFTDFTLDANEVSNVGWFSQDEIKNLNLYKEYRNALDIYYK